MEALPEVTAASVTRIGPTLEGGYTWSITFFADKRPAEKVFGSGVNSDMHRDGDLPLMIADTASLGATLGFGHFKTVWHIDTFLNVEEVVRGSGMPDLWRIETGADHIDQVQIVRMKLDSRSRAAVEMWVGFEDGDWSP